MFPAVSMICGVAARACLPMCLHMSCSDLNFSCLLHWSLWINTLDRSLPWSPYLQCACSIELYRSLLWSPILLIQHPALLTPHKLWDSSWWVSGQVSFSIEVPSVWQDRLVAACGACSRSQGCHGTPLLCMVFASDPYQSLLEPVPRLINWWWV